MSILVFDLDDTLLGRDKKIGLDTKRELMNCPEHGDVIVFASSRPIRAVRDFIDDDVLSIATVISLNGAVRHNIDGSVDRFSSIGDRVEGLLTHLEFNRNVRFSIELAGEKFGSNVVHSDEELWDYHSATPEMVLALDDIELSEISKVAIDGLGNDITFLISEIVNLNLRPTPCLDGTFINVVDLDVDKSTTLEKTLASNGHSESDIFVFGDDIPDIRMMELGTRSIAMKNARDQVKAVAHEIIGDCDDDCIGAYIRKLR